MTEEAPLGRASGLDMLGVRRYGAEPLEGLLAGPASILARLRAVAEEHPDDVAFTVVPISGEDTMLSYGTLYDLSRRLSFWLRNELEILPGDVIALAPTNDASSVIAIFALMSAGARIFFVNPDEKPGRLQELLDGRQVQHLLCADHGKAAQLPGAVTLPDASRLERDPSDAEAPFFSLADVAFYFGTSGSTAASKIVAQTHENISANAEALRILHQLGRDTVFLGCLPIHHVNGLHFTIMATVWSGGHTILLERFELLRFVECMKRFRPHVASVVPSLLEMLLCYPDGESFIPGEFRYFVSAAAPLSASTSRKILDRFNVRVNQGFGLTETTNFSTTLPPGLSDAEYRRLMIDAEIPSIGSAVIGNEVAILRNDGSRAEPGERGEVCVRGFNVMANYDRNDDATREAMRGGWFHSGDIGYFTRSAETGEEFFFLTGRLKNIAKVMGVAVSLEEMEHVLMEHPAVLDVACYAEPDEFLGDAVAAAVVSDEGLDDDELRNHLMARFAIGVLPQRFIRTPRIPRTPTGKVIRAGLAAALGQRRDELWRADPNAG